MNKFSNGEIKRKVKDKVEKRVEREIQQFSQLQKYLKDIKKTRPLSLKEENKLWKTIRAPLVWPHQKGDEKLKSKIFKANLKLVVQSAEKYKDNPYFTPLELVQIGEKALQQAIEAHKWNWEEKKGKFQSYAMFMIRQAIYNAIKRERNLILTGKDTTVLIHRDKKGGPITGITGSTRTDEMITYEKFTRTKEEIQKEGKKIEKRWKELAEAEKEAKDYLSKKVNSIQSKK